LKHGLERIRFDLPPSDWHDHAAERLWAEALGHDRYRLRNSPFYAYGVSFEDIVKARRDEVGQLVFETVVIRGGRSTYRLFAQTELDSESSRSSWQKLEALGCRYESNGRLISVDVPATTDIYEVYAQLEQGVRDRAWDFEEAHCGHEVTQRR